MKNVKVYFMLFAVVLVWGILIYRLKGDEELETSNISVNHFVVSSGPEKHKVTFSIDGSYPDPFLGSPDMSITSINKTNIKKEFAAKEKIEHESMKREWPKIQYLGMVTNLKSRTELALVSVNEITETLKPGQLFNSIKLRKIFRDSIIVEFGNKSKTFKK